MNTLKEWIKHLQHPLVLAGFALFIMLEIFQMFFRDSLATRLSGMALEKLLGKGMAFAFILALVAVVGGILLSWRKSSPAAVKNDLTTQGDQSPSVRSGGKVTISYGGAVSGGKKAGAAQAVTQGGQSPAVEAKKDVEIKYEK